MTEGGCIFYQETFGTDELANKYQIQETKIDQVKDCVATDSWANCSL
jgi:hypothetical protein